MSLNVTLLKKVRDAIARSRTRRRFDMGTWMELSNGELSWVDTVGEFRDAREEIQEGVCQTTACIAGWTVLVGADQTTGMRRHTTIRGAAARMLGIGREDATYLFQGVWSSDPETLEITKREALDYLDECIAAGEIVRLESSAWTP